MKFVAAVLGQKTEHAIRYGSPGPKMEHEIRYGIPGPKEFAHG
jgi:hypothetical protein